MTVEEIKGNIRYNEQLIDQLLREKNKLEAQIDELDALKAKLANLQVSFESKQKYRQQKLSVLPGSGIQNRALTRYYDGMNSLLSGSEFHSAYEGLSESKRAVSKEISNLYQQIDEHEESLLYRKDRLHYWKHQLQMKQAELACTKATVGVE